MTGAGDRFARRITPLPLRRWWAVDRIRVPARSRLAHNGVLFLDELPEFSPRVLEALREPLETGSITSRGPRGKQNSRHSSSW